MDGILDHDLPQGPVGKAEVKAQQQSLLLARRQEEALRAKKARLVEAIRNTEEAIVEERERKRVLQTQARDLRMRMERLAALAPDLVKEKERQKEHIKIRESHQEKRTAPLTLNPNDGLLTFQQIGLGKYPPEITRKGPSSSRTGFVRDYKGRLYLGGSDEGKKSETQMYKLAQKEVERRRSEARRTNELTNGGGGCDQSMVTSSFSNGPANTTATSATVGSSPTAPLPSIKIRNSKRVVDDAPHLHKNTVYGKSSHLDLDKAKTMSSKRSRYYTDYEGRRIAMDPSDWPTSNGLMLL